MAESKEIMLYSYYRSSCSWRVRIALALKQIPYTYKAVSLIEGQQNTAEYIKLNPMKEVPALVIDNHTLSQSMAIINYLDETRPNPPLFPTNPYLRAKTRQLCEIITTDIQPVQNLRVLNMVKSKLNEKESTEWGRHWIENGFNGLEVELCTTAGKYSIGDNVTAVDLCLIPQLYNARRFSVDLSKYPTICRIEKELNVLPAFIAAHADKQPDTPKTAVTAPSK